MYYTYMIRCEDNSIYTGMTSDIDRRIKEHFGELDSNCAKYTMSHKAIKVEAVWQSETRALASKLEYHIKKLKKQEKEELIKLDNLKKYLSEKIDVKKYKKVDE